VQERRFILRRKKRGSSAGPGACKKASQTEGVAHCPVKGPDLVSVRRMGKDITAIGLITPTEEVTEGVRSREGYTGTRYESEHQGKRSGTLESEGPVKPLEGGPRFGDDEEKGWGRMRGLIQHPAYRRGTHCSGRTQPPGTPKSPATSTRIIRSPTYKLASTGPKKL